MARPKRRAHPDRSIPKGSRSEEKVKAQRALRVKEANARWDAYQAQFTSPEFKRNWINDSRPLCPCCVLPNDTIKCRIDPFILEIHGREEILESCIHCYNMWRLEI